MRGLLFASLLAVAGCVPAEYKPLDYAPSAEARETWHLSEDSELRYDGHWVHDAIGKQTAGDLEARTRTFASKDAPGIELVTVSPLGTRDYYAAVHAVIEAAKPDVVIATFAVKGDESDPRRGGRRARRGEDAEVERFRAVVAVFPDLTFPRDALAWDERFVPPQLTGTDIAFVESATEGMKLPTDEQIEDLRRAANYLGPDVILHNLAIELVDPAQEVGGWSLRRDRTERIREGAPPLPETPPRTASFVAGAAAASAIGDPEERRRALLEAFATHRLAEATLEALDLSAAAGAKRFVILALHETACGLSSRLLARGYRVERERWLPAIPILGRFKKAG